jgi:hypothetical protein
VRNRESGAAPAPSKPLQDWQDRATPSNSSSPETVVSPATMVTSRRSEGSQSSRPFNQTNRTINDYRHNNVVQLVNRFGLWSILKIVLRCSSVLMLLFRALCTMAGVPKHFHSRAPYGVQIQFCSFKANFLTSLYISTFIMCSRDI